MVKARRWKLSLRPCRGQTGGWGWGETEVKETRERLVMGSLILGLQGQGLLRGEGAASPLEGEGGIEKQCVRAGGRSKFPSKGGQGFPPEAGKGFVVRKVLGSGDTLLRCIHYKTICAKCTSIFYALSA